MESERLRNTIVVALARPEVHKINFHCGTRTVNFSTFMRVTEGLTKKKLGVEVDPDELDDLTEASYSSRRHTYFFSSPFYGATEFEQGVIVHESVHAGFDVIGHGGNFKRIDNEPSAYLAESFFLLNTGFLFDKIRNVLSLRLAFTIALNMQSKKQISVSADDLLLLRNGIARMQIVNHGTDTRKGTDQRHNP
jgi:hypothetical protein